MPRAVAGIASMLLVTVACSGGGGLDTDRSAAPSPPSASTTEEASGTAAPPPTVAPTTPPAEPRWEEVAGGPECGCADGSDWSFWVREADPARVVLFFQGGGACFSADTCRFVDGSYKVTGGTADDPSGRAGVFDFANPDNPLADWSFVFVPYCTGDVHLGDNVQEYGDDLVVRHNGYNNAARALTELVARFPDAAEVFVTGSSAGGVPAPLFAGLVGDALPEARIAALADGSGGYADSPGVNAVIGALWGSTANIPAWPVNEGLGAADWGIPTLFVQAGLHRPDIVFARHDHAFDSVQERFAQLSGLLTGPMVDLIDANAAAIEADGVPVATYVAPGTDHTILGRPELYSQAVDGVAVVDWVTALVEGGSPGDVHCTDCGASVLETGG